MRRRSLIFLWSFLFFLSACECVCVGGVIYVDADATLGTGNGFSWTNAFVHLQDGLSAAKAGDEIRVAAGVYYPDSSSVSPAGSKDRGAAFGLISGVTLLGGFGGLGESDPNSRDFAAYETVLSGDLAGDDVRIGSASDLRDDTSHDENCFHVVVGLGVDETAVIDGFTISGGNADDFALGSGGGGLYVHEGSPTVAHCRFIGNLAHSGGGLLNSEESNSLVVNCLFAGNWAYDCGGGAYNSSSYPEYRNCLFSGNNAEDYGGGGMWHSGGTATIVNCTFSGNWASDGGSGLYVSSGHVAVNSSIIYEEITTIGGTAGFVYSDVPSGLGGMGCISVDPLFVDADGADGLVGTGDDNCRLGIESACIDAGDPGRLTDPWEFGLGGVRRIQYGVVDMGAYEYIVVPSLVGHWKLDEVSGLTAADSAGSHDGAIEGDPVWGPDAGRMGGTLTFDADGDYINCGRGKEFDIRDEITVSAWIKVEEFTTGWQAIATKGDSAWRIQSAGKDDLPGTLEFACTGVLVPYSEEWGNIEGNIRVDDGKWHHVAGVYDGYSISLYVDGLLDVTSVASGRINENDFDVLIGENAERGGRFWNGQIDDVRVYNYALNHYEIGELAVPSTTHHVDIAGGDDSNDGLSRETSLRSIRAAVYGAQHGDTILVWPGVYDEEVFFEGKAITIRSAADAAVLELSAPWGFAFSFQQGEGAGSVLSNFVIRNSAGAIFCNSASPTIRNLTIVNNEFGIEAFGGANPDISNCIFWNNIYGNTAGCQSRYSWDWVPVGAVAHWRFDEVGGTRTIFDSEGLNHGSITEQTARVGGECGGALEFDSIDDYAAIANSASLSVGRMDYTLSAWIRPDRVDEINAILSKVSGSADKEYLFYVDNGRLRLDVEKGDNNGRAFSERVVTARTWQHVAVTFDSSSLTATFYRNGFVVGQESSNYPITTLPDNLGAELWIGMRSGEPYGDREFSGRIDEVMIFARELSPEGISVAYKSGLNPQFGDAANNDYRLRSEKGRFVALEAAVAGGIEGLWAFDEVTSPCVDGGDPSERAVRERMPNGGRVNMGAYGNTAFASMSEWPLKGDVNRDGAVNLTDLSIMGWNWLSVLPWAANY